MNAVEENVKQQKEGLVLERFMEVIKAPYGDFSALGQLSEALNETYSLQPLVEFLSLDPQGKRAFEERPRLGNVNLQQLHQLPENTFGYLYADQMLRNGFSPVPAREIADDDYSFLSAHIAETHDIWHVVTGCDTDKAGEIQLQAFYVAQLSASRFFLALVSKNVMKTALEDIELCDRHMDALAQGWLLGKQARPLFGIQWNKLWETPLETLRVQLNLAQPAGSVTAAKVD